MVEISVLKVMRWNAVLVSEEYGVKDAVKDDEMIAMSGEGAAPAFNGFR